MLQILIVTSQLIKEENGKFFCIENFYDIIKRFSQLGQLHICAAKYEKKTSNVIDTDVAKIVKPEHIHFIKHTYLWTDRESQNVIKQAVKNSDLVIGYVPCINAYTAQRFAKKYNKRFLSYVVGCPWDAFWNHGILGKIIAPYAFFSLKNCLKKSDYALYVTEKFLQKRYPCQGLTCGCSDVRIPRIDEEILKKRLDWLNNVDENTFNIVTIASYTVKYKGQHFVIKALAKLKRMGIMNFHYHLIGSGDKSRLENLAKKLDVLDLIHFDGIVPHNKIFEKLDKMHIYIQPSLQEGLPRSVVEAMSRGLTCICANTAAMPEMVESEYVVGRKSVNDIVRVLKELNVNNMAIQANRNFEEAKKYSEECLEKKRNVFFKKILFQIEETRK